MQRIQKAKLVLPAIAFFLCIFCAVAQTPSDPPNLPPFLDAMTADFYKPMITVGMGSFTYAESQLPTPFARWFEDELRQSLTRTTNLKFFDKQVAAAMDPSIREKYKDFFGAEVVDSLLYGKYSADGRSVQVTISLTDLSTGQLISEKKLVMTVAQLPPGLRVEPMVQTLQTASSLKYLAAGASAVDPGFKLSMSTDRGAGATYRDGENLVLLVTCSREAYLKIYHVDVNGVAQLIWPNRFGGSGKISKGEAMRFPAAGDRFQFKLQAPYGTEYIKAIASAVPFATMEPDFSDLAGSAAAAITRGLSVTSTNASNRAEALAVYEILP